MDYKEYFRKLENDKKYQETEQNFKLILDLADEILRLRMEKGWSQTELARRAETKQANISRLESGLSNPSVNFLQKVAKALDTTVTINFEKITASQIKISTDTESQSIYIPNWPQGETYKSYRSSSTVEKL
jgi:transcriptional regulator with XRE-family HTH domain